MMSLGTTHMAEPEETRPSPLWRWARIAALSTLLLFLVGVTVGFTIGHLEKESGSFTAMGIAILALILALSAGCLWLLVRMLRVPIGDGPPTAKERLNRNILIVCGALGAVTALLMILAQGRGWMDNPQIFSNDPLPPAVAIALIFVTGVLTPAISFYWHRSAIDEQELDAYKTGALYGLYVYMIGAPVWWFAWRGGFLPAPDGVVIYFVTICTVGAVWLWKKYR